MGTTQAEKALTSLVVAEATEVEAISHAGVVVPSTSQPSSKHSHKVSNMFLRRPIISRRLVSPRSSPNLLRPSLPL